MMQQPVPSPAVNEAHDRLQAMVELLRQPNSFDAAARAALADLVAELDRALNSGAIAHDKVQHLAACAAHFAESVHQSEDQSAFDKARSRLEEAVVAAETNAPLVAGLARRWMDALSNIGI